MWTFWTKKVDFLNLTPLTLLKTPHFCPLVTKSGPFRRFGVVRYTHAPTPPGYGPEQKTKKTKIQTNNNNIINLQTKTFGRIKLLGALLRRVGVTFINKYRTHAKNTTASIRLTCRNSYLLVTQVIQLGILQ